MQVYELCFMQNQFTSFPFYINKALDCKRMNFKTVEKALSDIQDR